MCFFSSGPQRCAMWEGVRLLSGAIHVCVSMYFPLPEHVHTVPYMCNGIQYIHVGVCSLSVNVLYIRLPASKRENHNENKRRQRNREINKVETNEFLFNSMLHLLTRCTHASDTTAETKILLFIYEYVCGVWRDVYIESVCTWPLASTRTTARYEIVFSSFSSFTSLSITHRCILR